MQDEQQRQSQWTEVARLQWMAAAVLGNGWQDSKAIAMGSGMVVAQGTAQRAAADCRLRRSSAMKGDARWTVAGIRMDGGGVIEMDDGSSNGQWWRNEQWDGKAFAAMGNGTGTGQWMAQ
jgi:hypothetical protein